MPDTQQVLACAHRLAQEARRPLLGFAKKCDSSWPALWNMSLDGEAVGTTVPTADRNRAVLPATQV